MKFNFSNIKWWYWVLIVLSVLAFFEIFLSEPKDSNINAKDVVVRNGKIVEGAVVSTSENVDNTSSHNSKNQFGSPLSPRMVGVPSYDIRLMAANIISEAVDQDAAAIFISLQQTRRNARLQAEIAKLQATIKENEASFAEANAKIKAFGNDKNMSLRTKDMSLVGYDPQTGNSFNTTGVNDVGVEKIGKPLMDSLRLKLVNDQTGTMSFQIGDTWYTGVKSGQTINGHLVGTLDIQLKCVPLTKSEVTTVLCLN